MEPSSFRRRSPSLSSAPVLILFLAAVMGCGTAQPGGNGADAGGTAGTAGAAPPDNAAGGGTAPAAGAAGGTPVDAGPALDTGAGPGTGGADATSGPDAPRGDGAASVDPGTEGDGVLAIAAPFKPAPEMSDQAGVAKGQVIQFTMATNTTFNDGSRKVAVYIPAGYVSDAEVPFMVAQDGIGAQSGGSFGLDDLRPLLDNMIAAKTLPMMAGIFVDPAGQRSVEYDTVSDKYFQFVETEVLPAAVAQAKTKNITLNLTKDPQGRGSFGGSSGGAAAFTMGWFHPEAYTRILTISGSFVKLQSSAMYPNGAADYYMTLIPSAPAKPLRVFLEAGSADLGSGRWRTGNDMTAAALMAKAYHYRYVTAEGAMHEDDGARRQYLPTAMEWLWRGYPIAGK